MPTITVTITDAQAASVAARLTAGTPRGETPPTVQEWVTQQVLSNVEACANQNRAEELAKLGPITDVDIALLKGYR